MKDSAVRTWMMIMLVGICLTLWSSSQSAEAQRKTTSASQAAGIAKFFIEEPKGDSAYETGPLHIIYEDGTEFVKTLPRLEASTEKVTVFNAVGFSDVRLAEDRQTLGWTIRFQNCCTSYSIPLTVVAFRHKRVIHTFDSEQMVWDWMFLEGGKRVAIVFGPVHGSEVGDYRLYDVKTRKLLSRVMGDEGTQALKPNAPEWSRRLQDHLHSR